jgi:hypothetical protein
MAAPERPAPGRGGRHPGDRPCAHPGCPEPGEYRAPLHRPGSAFAPAAGPPPVQYFCLAHVREFNASWNWFEGMTADEIWQAQSPYPRWEREVEAFARRSDPRRPAAGIDDPLGVLRWKAGARTPSRLPAEDRRALDVLGLPETATPADVKRRYRALVRRYHPDANAGDRRHEARLIAVREAHDRLMRSRSFNRG